MENQNTQQNQNLNNQPIINSSESTKNNWLNSMMFLVFGILIGIIGLLVYQKYFVNKNIVVVNDKITPSQTPIINTTTPSPIPTTTPDPTVNWKTYNGKYFSFRYPKNWYYQLYPYSTETVFLDDHNFEILYQTEFITPIFISFNEVEDATTHEKYLLETNIETSAARMMQEFDEQTLKKINLTIDNKPAIQISGILKPERPLEGSFFKRTFIQTGKNVLQVTLSKKEFEDIYDQILSTFKFLN
jgi:hypothetical protein